MELEGIIRSVRAGKIRQFFIPGEDGAVRKTWRSAIAKEEISGDVAVIELGIEGDEHSDQKHHGGVDKAVLAYSGDHLPAWRKEYGKIPWKEGDFGENLTIDGLTETDVCLGDLWEACDVLFEVSQPREPCGKMVLLHQWSDLPRRMTETAWTGWYLRVKRGGPIRAGVKIRLIERPQPEWTVERMTRAMNENRNDLELARALAANETLAQSWRDVFRKRLEANA